MLSKYASEIIKILVHQDDKFITNAQIAKMLNVSERSVSSYMNEVAQYCEERNYHLIRKRGKGICLRLGVHKEELEQEFPEKNLCIETREYRISYIIRTLIESKEPYTAALFADELFVSKATIRTDIEKANQSLEADHIKIYQTTGRGIEIKGKEFDLRRVLVRENRKIVMEKEDRITDETFADYRIEPEFYRRLVIQYRKKNVDKVIYCVQRLERKIASQMNDYTFCMAVEYIGNQIKRLKKECYLEENMINRLGLVDEITEWADYLINYLNHEFKMNIDPREGLYLYILLLAVEVQNSSRIVNKKFLLDKEIYIQDVTEDVIDYISSIVGKNFKEDMLLKTSVALFLNSSLVRVRFGFQIHNPFLDEIKQRYPAIFSACFTSSQVYEKLMGMGQILARKVEDKIPEINVTSVLSANSAHLIDEDQYDLVITTISKLKISHSYVAYTTPIVSQQDVYRIQKKCHQMKETKKNHNQEYTISSLIKKEFILIEKEVMSKEEILKKGCDLLYKNEYVKQGFYEDVLKREEISASVLGGGVALPHGMANLVIKPAVVIMKCAQRTEWQDGCVDIVFLLALNFEDIQSTRAFFSSFYEMTMEKNTAFLIRKAETEEEIMDVIMNSMNETEE
jgi:activator of the mannose operon (transcriptional antiterminator)